MAAKKNKKRQHSRTVELKRQQEQERLADAKDRAKKRMDPTARLLLYGDLVFLALLSLLDYNNLIPELAGAVGTVIGVILLLLALWFQFKRTPDSGTKGTRL